MGVCRYLAARGSTLSVGLSLRPPRSDIAAHIVYAVMRIRHYHLYRGVSGEIG